MEQQSDIRVTNDKIVIPICGDLKTRNDFKNDVRILFSNADLDNVQKGLFNLDDLASGIRMRVSKEKVLNHSVSPDVEKFLIKKNKGNEDKIKKSKNYLNAVFEIACKINQCKTYFTIDGEKCNVDSYNHDENSFPPLKIDKQSENKMNQKDDKKERIVGATSTDEPDFIGKVPPKYVPATKKVNWNDIVDENNIVVKDVNKMKGPITVGKKDVPAISSFQAKEKIEKVISKAKEDNKSKNDVNSDEINEMKELIKKLEEEKRVLENTVSQRDDLIKNVKSELTDLKSKNSELLKENNDLKDQVRIKEEENADQNKKMIEKGDEIKMMLKKQSEMQEEIDEVQQLYYDECNKEQIVQDQKSTSVIQDMIKVADDLENFVIKNDGHSNYSELDTKKQLSSILNDDSEFVITTTRIPRHKYHVNSRVIHISGVFDKLIWNENEYAFKFITHGLGVYIKNE
jgi:hypothetical protein